MPSYSIGFCVATTKKGCFERVRHAVDRHLRLLHRLEQRGLRLRGRAVDLVDEQDVGEDGPRPEFEPPGPLAEDVHARDVGGKEIRRELQPRERKLKRAGDGLREHRLPHSGEVLDDQMPLRDETENAELEGRAWHSDGSLKILDDALDDIGSRRRCDRPLRARGVRHAFESSRSTSSRTAAATARFDAFATTRSPFSDTTTTSFSAASKPMSAREMSL